MAEYAKWREQVERVRQMVREAEESSALYRSKPLDFDAFWKELDLEMDERHSGISVNGSRNLDRCRQS